MGISKIPSQQVKSVTVTKTTTSSGYIEGTTYDLFGVSDAKILAVYFERGTYSAFRTVSIMNYGTHGYRLTFKTNGSDVVSSNVTYTVFYL